MTEFFSQRARNEIAISSQEVAVDMCEGGDDPEMVAEAALDGYLQMNYPYAYDEVVGLVGKFGLRRVFAEAAKIVRTL